MSYLEGTHYLYTLSVDIGLLIDALGKCIVRMPCDNNISPFSAPNSRKQPNSVYKIYPIGYWRVCVIEKLTK